MKVVIIGGVAGGATAAARLRRLDENAEIVLLERGGFISFANCGLPYYIGGEITDQSALTLQTPGSFNARFNVDVRVENEVTAIDTKAHQVTVVNHGCRKTYTEAYDQLILSMGAEPFIPPIQGVDSDKVLTLRNIPDTLKIKAYIQNKKPKTAVVIGGGNIGLEMADNLTSAGLKVTVVEMMDHVVAPLDMDMAADVENYLESKGVTVLTGNGVTAMEDLGKTLKLTLKEGALQVDMCILSVGVRPETKIADQAGVALNQKGAMIVDDQMRTNIQDIFAVGDAVEVRHFITGEPAMIQLAGPANKEARVAADVICGLDSHYTGSQGSAVLKIFDMSVASTGLNEKQAQAAGITYDKVYTFSPSHAGYYPGAHNMSVKVLWNTANQEIIGAQIVGYDGVDKRMDVLATAIRFGGKITDLTQLELCYAPPFGSAKDPVNFSGFVAENIITGKMKQFFWHDVAGLPRDGSVTLLDVRTDGEVAGGRIDGFKHIPLDTLRDHLDEIPGGKPVYVHCHSGLRSYVACRILAGHGYDCYNLAGGYRLYASVMTKLSR
ncbi:MAG: FAD-dependent oxidoreductase [Eubacteriaceae bacterium]|nr:FAD-dependent oxidoreductase [Eubacteriaceae bacterium]